MQGVEGSIGFGVKFYIGNEHHNSTRIYSSEEYLEWKINWPDTADLCGHAMPRKQWRKGK